MRNTAKLADFAFVNPVTDTNRTTADAAVTFIPMAAVAEGGGWHSTENRPLSDGRRGYTLFRRSDVIVAKITPCFENGKVALLSELETDFGLGSTEFHVLRAKPGHDPRFIYHWTRHPAFLRAGEASMTGSAGQRRVPSGFFERFEITAIEGSSHGLIADILDSIDDAILETDAAIAKHELVALGLLDDLLAKPDHPKRELGSLCSFISGSAFPERLQGRRFGDLPFVKVSDFPDTREIHAVDTRNWVSRTEARNFGWKVAPPRTIIFAKVGGALLLNRHYISADEVVFDNNILGISPFNSTDVLWVFHWLETFDFAEIAQTGALPSINQAALASLELPYPHEPARKKAVEVFEAQYHELETLRVERSKLANLRRALRDDLLTGRKPVVAILEPAK